MRVSYLIGFVVVCLLAVPSSADEASVKQMIDAYAKAFNAKQLDSVIGYWTETGVHVDRESGQRTEGREAIRADIAQSFAERPSNRIFGRIERIRFVKPDVANVDGNVTVSATDGDPTATRFSAILVNQDGKWMIDSIEEFPIDVPANAGDALADLGFLVGHWVDQSDDGRVDTVFRWTANGAFLLRSYAVAGANGEGREQEGTQVIGWDPRSNEIRSWSFNSDGSFGDATWSKSGEDWLIRGTQTLANGDAASGTFVLSRIGDDSISMKLIGHEIEGEPQPSGQAVTAVRVIESDATADAAQAE